MIIEIPTEFLKSWQERRLDLEHKVSQGHIDMMRLRIGSNTWIPANYDVITGMLSKIGAGEKRIPVVVNFTDDELLFFHNEIKEHIGNEALDTDMFEKFRTLYYDIRRKLNAKYPR